MKVSVNKVNELTRELHIEVPKEKVTDTLNQVYEEIQKTAKIPGFRPGTAPRHILEKHHAKLAQEEVVKHLLPETYQAALEQEKLEVLSLPEISELKMGPGSGLQYKATVEIRPTIEIKEYKSIKIKKRATDVTDEDLSKTLDEIKKMRNAQEINEEFAHGLGYGSLGEFKDALKRQLGAQKEQQNRAQYERDVIDYLFKHSKFTVPESLVKRRYQELKDELNNYLAQGKLPKDEIEKKEKEFEQRLQDQAHEQVKTFLLLDEIAKRENIARDDSMPTKTMEFLFKNAEWSQ